MSRACALLALILVLVAGCRPAGSPSAQPSPSAPPTAPASSPTPPGVAGPHDTPPPVNLTDAPAGLLLSLHTEHHADHDRVVFQFSGRQVPDPSIQYVDRVTADPSDRPVPLAGTAYVRIAFHGGRLDTGPVEPDPAKARRYPGPTHLTPDYPLLRELNLVGDYEAVLSFALGLSAVAGLSTTTSGGTLALDLWRTAPATMLWPITSLAQAREVQDATRAGHQPWTLDASEVASHYVASVLHRTAQLRQLRANVFQAVGADHTLVAVITLSQPLGQPGTVWTVASVVRVG
jgi:hypothetical protein